jgi:hypothetical protein
MLLRALSISETVMINLLHYYVKQQIRKKKSSLFLFQLFSFRKSCSLEHRRQSYTRALQTTACGPHPTRRTLLTDSRTLLINVLKTKFKKIRGNNSLAKKHLSFIICICLWALLVDLFQCLLALTSVKKNFLKWNMSSPRTRHLWYALKSILVTVSTELEPHLDKISLGKHQYHTSD